MATARTLVAMDFGFGDESDLSSAAHVVRKRGSVHVDRTAKRLRFDGPGYLEVEPTEALEALDDFTIELLVKPESLIEAQQLLEGGSPPASLSLDSDGQIVGSVLTSRGRLSVESGPGSVRAGEETRVRLIYDAAEGLSLEIDDHHAGSTLAKGKLALGSGGLVLGIKADRTSGQFRGEIGEFRIRNGAINAMELYQRVQKADSLAYQLKDLLGFAGNVNVEPDPDAVDHRFDTIKGILSAAGVSDVSALAGITIDRTTVIHPNTLMVAPLKNLGPAIDWGTVATSIATSDIGDAVVGTATVLPNRHSTALLRRLAGSDENADASSALSSGEGNNPGSGDVPNREDSGEASDDDGPSGVIGDESMTRGRAIRPTVLAADLVSGSFDAGTITGLRASREAGRIHFQPISGHLALRSRPTISDLIRPARGVEIFDPDILDDMDGDEPSDWPVHASPLLYMTSIVSIPVNTSVIIAGQLDLTNHELVIEPSVETLYIIAEEIIGDVNASITWRRPDGTTPGMADDPAKNGRSYSGVLTPSGSRNGLRGGDGLDGDPGIGGSNGIDAPNLEVWVKHLTAMPDIDLNGEEGIRGGRGQRGGRGGNGARGEGGEWWWFFGAHCWKSPGHGGNGGNGGRGGRGGPGGDGGRGGNISIGVLEGTLADSVTARSFKVKNQGGQAGEGGGGGPGGSGGSGGTHGNDYVDGEEICGDGVDGTPGAQGQPGPDGADGRPGQDATLNFFEFTEESWNEQLTRPWLYELTPTQVFPGNDLVITGSRFADTDRVILDGITLTPEILADESLRVTVPNTVDGGEKELFVTRYDGPESNRLRVWVKPQLNALTDPVVPGGTTTLRGEAFVTGASVLYNGAGLLADSVTRTRVRFAVPILGIGDSAEQDVTVAVRNPDGLVSNVRTATIPRTIDSGLDVEVHGLEFVNFDDGSPSWGTFEETFGAFEVWHELLDPIFGHPVLTTAFYIFYEHFLKGEGNGGLATGFCTSLSALVLDEFWTGSTDTYSRITLDSAMRSHLTGIHGRLLSRESLIEFHDQGRQETANVTTSFRAIEQNLRDGGDRESSLMLFFVPSGAFWDEGYFDSLGDSHCIVPYKIVYPVGHDGTSIDGVTMYCWDCNHPYDPASPDTAHNCRLVFRLTDGEIRYDYYDGGTSTKFSSEDGVTLATMTNGKYLLSDHDMPFSGPLGVTRFVLDFLLSPAELLVENELGQQTGNDAGTLIAEIPDSHPAYLVKGAYLLPADEPLTRYIRGTGVGTYSYHSIAPGGVSISLEDVDTSAGEEDVLAVNADGTSIRLTPGTSKTFTLNLARETDAQARGVTVTGFGGGPTTATDINLSPDLSVVRVSNADTDRVVDIQVSQLVKETGASASLDRNGVSVPTHHDLVVTVTDWDDLAVTARSLPFE